MASAAAATGAAASAFCPLSAPQRLILTSSSSKSFKVQCSLKSIPSWGLSFSLVESKSPVVIRDSRRRPFALKASNSSQDSASESDEEDESSADKLDSPDKDAEDSSPSSLELALSAYKEAIINGDVKTISDVEAVIYGAEKEKNEFLEKVSSLSDEISSLKDKYIRLQADFDNYRKRSENEKLNIRSDAQGEVIETLLPMVDNFERAKQHLKLETEQEKKIDASYQGIYKQFVEIMKSLRVSAVPTVGSPFDPSIHEAIAREESEEFDESTVIQEFRRGFTLQDRLLRPAMVKVSAGPGPRKAASSEKDETSSEQATSAEVDERAFSEQSTA